MLYKNIKFSIKKIVNYDGSGHWGEKNSIVLLSQV